MINLSLWWSIAVCKVDLRLNMREIEVVAWSKVQQSLAWSWITWWWAVKQCEGRKLNPTMAWSSVSSLNLLKEGGGLAGLLLPAVVRRAVHRVADQGGRGGGGGDAWGEGRGETNKHSQNIITWMWGPRSDWAHSLFGSSVSARLGSRNHHPGESWCVLVNIWKIVKVWKKM